MNPLRELRYLADLIEAQTQRPVRVLMLSDFKARARGLGLDDAQFVEALTQAAAPMTNKKAAILLRGYLDRLTTPREPDVVDLLIVCIKPVELNALQVALDLQPGQPGDAALASGHHQFDGVIPSTQAGRDLTYRLIGLQSQGNVRTAAAMRNVLTTCHPRLAVLFGTAGGHSAKVETGDVVAAETVIYTGPGTRSDNGRTSDPDQHQPAQRLAVELRYAQPTMHGWHERFAVAIDRARRFENLTVSDEVNMTPTWTTGAIVTDDDKDETTSLDTTLDRISGDAKAYDMDSSGFVSACHTVGVDWLVIRGIADFGRKDPTPPDGSGTAAALGRRPKSQQLTATIAAATAFLTWVDRQCNFFGYPRQTRSADT